MEFFSVPEAMGAVLRRKRIPGIAGRSASGHPCHRTPSSAERFRTRSRLGTEGSHPRDYRRPGKKNLKTRGNRRTTVLFRPRSWTTAGKQSDRSDGAETPFGQSGHFGGSGRTCSGNETGPFGFWPKINRGPARKPEPLGLGRRGLGGSGGFFL